MKQRLLPVLRWALYTFGGLVALVGQQAVFARLPVWGAVPCLVPVAAALVAVREGPERGGLFSLCLGLVWSLAGARYGPMYIFLLPLSAVLAGGACQSLFTKSLLPSLLMAAMTLALCEGAVLVLRLYLGMGQPLVAGVELLYSLLFVFPLYPIVWAISRIGGT